jgi:hypothetical protein
MGGNYGQPEDFFGSVFRKPPPLIERRSPERFHTATDAMESNNIKSETAEAQLGNQPQPGDLDPGLGLTAYTGNPTYPQSSRRRPTSKEPASRQSLPISTTADWC